MGVPTIPNIQPLIDAGIDPSTGLPIKLGANLCALKDAVKKTMRVMDEQEAVNRYTWYNLPNGLNSQMLERILYYKGQCILFYMKSNDKFYFLPYALDGTIDVYGRYLCVTPLPFNGTNQDGKNLKPWIQGLKKYPVYDIMDMFDDKGMLIHPVEDCCVILYDYTNQQSQTIISRQILNDPILDAISEAFPFARTSLLANSGIKGMRVNDQDSAAQVKLASKSVTHAAYTGDPWIPIASQIEFQELTEAGSALKSEEYLLYMQSVDNYRLSLYGLGQGGLFQKKSHMLESEQDMNTGNVGLVFNDGLSIRQRFCDIVNFMFAEQLDGQFIWCEPNECLTGVDENGDGYLAEEEDQSGVPGEQEEGSFDE